MSNLTAIIFGAGALGRAFLGPLLEQSGAHVVLVDTDTDLVQSLRKGVAAMLYDGNGKGELFRYRPQVMTLDELRQNGPRLLLSAVHVVAFSACRPDPYPDIVQEWPVAMPSVPWVALENLPGLMDKVKNVHGLDFRLGLADVLAVEPERGRLVHAENPIKSKARLWLDDGDILPKRMQGYRGIETLKPHLLRARWAARFLTHNTGHAAVAFAGKRLGYERMCDAARDDKVRQVGEWAMLEASTALVKSRSLLRSLAPGRLYNGMGKEMEDALAYYRQHELDRYASFPADTIERVERDPERKLARDDRLVGPLLAYMKAVQDGKPAGLLLAVRLGLAAMNAELPDALRTVCGLYEGKDKDAWDALQQLDVPGNLKQAFRLGDA